MSAADVDTAVIRAVCETIRTLCDALDARDAEIRKLRAEVARLNEFGESLAHRWADNAIEERDYARARLDEIRALLDEMPVWPDPRRIRAILDRPAGGAT